MAKATVHSLTRAERALIAETQPARLRELDEDELVALHGRARRARTKFVTVHRREVAERVQEAGGRGVVSDAPRRSASKAELFESALARVSAALAQAARRSAAELRAERLAAARRVPAAVGAAASAGHDAAPAAPRRASRRPIDRKVASSNRAAGARWQVSRDRRG